MFDEDDHQESRRPVPNYRSGTTWAWVCQTTRVCKDQEPMLPEKKGSMSELFSMEGCPKICLWWTNEPQSQFDARNHLRQWSKCSDVWWSTSKSGAICVYIDAQSHPSRCASGSGVLAVNKIATKAASNLHSCKRCQCKTALKQDKFTGCEGELTNKVKQSSLGMRAK
jgi:hypothetical protein